MYEFSIEVGDIGRVESSAWEDVFRCIQFRHIARGKSQEFNHSSWFYQGAVVFVLMDFLLQMRQRDKSYNVYTRAEVMRFFTFGPLLARQRCLPRQFPTVILEIDATHLGHPRYIVSAAREIKV